MRVVKIVFGVLAGVYALGHCVYLPKLLLAREQCKIKQVLSQGGNG